MPVEFIHFCVSGLLVSDACRLSPTSAHFLLTRTCSLGLAGGLSMIASDLIAVAATWRKTFRHVTQAASVGVSVSLSATLIQYAAIANSLKPSATVSTSAIDEFTTMLPNILISRFLIDLRYVHPPTPSDLSGPSHISTPHFRIPSLPEIIGNLGEPLASVDEAQEDETPMGGHGTTFCNERAHEMRNCDSSERVSQLIHIGNDNGEIMEVPRNMD
ncbi:hypothetical protein NM688_g741 [Phlebia brevispora]|uniref:Uncharacterized protein n=1 Tax=Phlebia brevispora TaxID=194682 RepID=A0ACC1TDC3_9APHY|nr:hypothetical protein NM688_g741 [Phlebia brevispora]